MSKKHIKFEGEVVLTPLFKCAVLVMMLLWLIDIQDVEPQ